MPLGTPLPPPPRPRLGWPAPRRRARGIMPSTAAALGGAARGCGVRPPEGLAGRMNRAGCTHSQRASPPRRPESPFGRAAAAFLGMARPGPARGGEGGTGTLGVVLPSFLALKPKSFPRGAARAARSRPPRAPGARGLQTPRLRLAAPSCAGGRPGHMSRRPAWAGGGAASAAGRGCGRRSPRRDPGSQRPARRRGTPSPLARVHPGGRQRCPAPGRPAQQVPAALRTPARAPAPAIFVASHQLPSAGGLEGRAGRGRGARPPPPLSPSAARAAAAPLRAPRPGAYRDLLCGVTAFRLNPASSSRPSSAPSPLPDARARRCSSPGKRVAPGTPLPRPPLRARVPASRGARRGAGALRALGDPGAAAGRPYVSAPPPELGWGDPRPGCRAVAAPRRALATRRSLALLCGTRSVFRAPRPLWCRISAFLGPDGLCRVRNEGNSAGSGARDGRESREGADAQLPPRSCADLT